MKWLQLIASLFFSIQLFAIDTFVEVKKFNSPTDGTYIEVQILIPANSVEYIEISETGERKAAVETKILIKQDDKIVDFDKYVLNSQSIKADEKASFNLLDVKRFALPIGKYNVEVICKDLNKKDSEKVINEEVNLDFPDNLITISNITLTEEIKKTDSPSSYTKSGYDIIPNIINFYSEEIKTVGFYAEIYNTDKAVADDEFLMSYAIMDQQNSKVIGEFKKFKKVAKSPLQVVLSSFNIEELASGNYRLTIEARDKKNELLASKSIPFQRSNPSKAAEQIDFKDVDINQTFVSNMSADTLSYYLKSILPLLEGQPYTMVETVSDSGDEEKMKKVLYNVWSQLYPHNSAGEFVGYQTVVDAVDNAFRTLQYHGFETDRGRIFLKYGEPTERIKKYSDYGSYPYEVWTYNRINETRQNNVKCIFYEPNQGTENFPLLHSEIRGERKNPNWQEEFYVIKDGSTNPYNNSMKLNESFKKDAEQLMNEFNDPTKWDYGNTFDDN